MMTKSLYLLSLAVVLIGLISCQGTKKASDLQAKSASLFDPYIGAWEVVVKDTPSGDYPCEVSIQRSGQSYTAKIHSNLGTIAFDKIDIDDEQFQGHFRYQGFKVKVKGTIEALTLQGRIGVLLAKYDMQGIKKSEYANSNY